MRSLGRGGLPGLAVAARAEADVDPAVDVRARATPRAGSSSCPSPAPIARRRRRRRAQVEARGSAPESSYSMSSPVGESNRNFVPKPSRWRKRSRKLNSTSGRVDSTSTPRVAEPSASRAHLDADGVARADRHELPGERIVQAYLTHGVRLHVDCSIACEISPRLGEQVQIGRSCRFRDLPGVDCPKPVFR